MYLGSRACVCVAGWPSNSSHYRNTAVTTVKNGKLPYHFHCSLADILAHPLHWQETERRFPTTVCLLPFLPPLSFSFFSASYLLPGPPPPPPPFRFYPPIVPYLRDGWLAGPEPFSARISRKLMPSSFRVGSRARRFIILPPPLPPVSSPLRPMVGGWHAGSRFSTTEAILYKNSRRGSRYSKFGRKLNGTGGSPDKHSIHGRSYQPCHASIASERPNSIGRGCFFLVSLSLSLSREVASRYNYT